MPTSTIHFSLSIWQLLHILIQGLSRYISLSIRGSLAPAVHLYSVEVLSLTSPSPFPAPIYQSTNLPIYVPDLPRSFATSATVTQLRAIYSFLLVGHYDRFVAGKSDSSGDGAP
jgi:hypothetical protein